MKKLPILKHNKTKPKYSLIVFIPVHQDRLIFLQFCQSHYLQFFIVKTRASCSCQVPSRMWTIPAMEDGMSGYSQNLTDAPARCEPPSHLFLFFKETWAVPWRDISVIPPLTHMSHHLSAESDNLFGEISFDETCAILHFSVFIALSDFTAVCGTVSHTCLLTQSQATSS